MTAEVAFGAGEPAIVLRDVFCVHRSTQGDAAALQGLDLSVARGERLCVLGPSGAGKSTLLRMIAGLQTPSAGRVQVLGVDAGRLRARERARLRHRSIGFLDQRADSTLAPELRIEQSVALPLALRGASRERRHARAGALLDAAGLGDRRRALPGELSGGERQRAALCAALAHRPALLLADEPTAELDEGSAVAVVELIEELALTEGTTVVMVTHDAALAARAQRVVRLHDGRIVEEASASGRGLVVGRGGWIRIPGELLREGAVGRLAQAAPVPGGLLLSAGANRESASEGGGAARGAGAGARGGVGAGARGGVGAGAGGRTKAAAGVIAPVRVELHAVSRSRGRGRGRRTVLDRLTASPAPGSLTAITGRSGSGKTTLLEILAGLAVPDDGEIVLDGRSLGGADAEARARIRRERIGYLPQEPSPVAFLSALENVVLALRVRGHSEPDATTIATAALADVGLAEQVRHQRVHRLSAGEAQRVALARALACAGGLLVVDEPTSRLDQSGAAAVARLLARTAADNGQTVICATHDPAIVRLADQVLELDRPEAATSATRPGPVRV